MDQKQVTVIIPALNEGEAIGDVVRGLQDKLPGIELIVINDGSSDNTREVAEKAGAKVISHEFPRGYGAGLTTGTLAATRDYVMFCDGDGQHTPEDVERLIDEIDGYDMVVGKRGNDSHHQLSRRPGKLVLKHFANYLAGQQIPDLNSGLRIINRSILLKYLHLMPTGFSFSTTSTFAMMKTGRRVKYIPIKVKARIGKSTVKQFKHGMQTIMLMLRLTVLFEPLKVFLTAAGGLLGCTILSYLIGGIRGDWGLSDSTVLLSVSTLLVFLFGLLCDQVSAIRRDRCL